MRMTVRRWVATAGAVAAAGALVYGQAGAATAARVSPAAPKAATSSPAYTPPSKPLYFGESGAAVKSVQRRLAQLHYYPGPIDGKYGDDVLEAAWAFREVQGLAMNSSTANQPIDKAFEHDLIHPRAPYRLVPKGGANRIEINLHIQVLVLYKNNEPDVILHVSSGGNCLIDQGCGWVTPDGNYHALEFLPGWVTVPLGYMYNPTFFIGTEYAIHGDVPVPWYPDSHGCVRIWMDAAQWFHKDVTIGGKHATPIYIRGTAPYYI